MLILVRPYVPAQKEHECFRYTEMKRINSVVILLLFFVGAYGQITVRGFIKDASTKEPLVGANIFDAATQNGTTSNHVGYFIYDGSKAQNTDITVSYVGYEQQLITITAAADTLITIELMPLSLEEIVVRAENEKPFDTPVGLVNISIKELEKIPQFFGEKDILKSLQTLPGISNSVEGTSGLVVRGGSVDQNLILFDEATVYNPNHLLGFVSVVNSDALKDLKMYKGGFPAQYGGRLSSVLDLTMKEGDKNESHQKFSLGVISSKLFFEGPIKKEKSSYFLSARSSYLGLLLLPQKWSFNNGNSENFFNYWLYDLNGKLSFDLKKNAKLQISYYRSFDKWKAVEGSQERPNIGILTWMNNLASVRYSRPIKDRLFSNLLFGYSSFKLETSQNSPDVKTKLSSGINDFFFKGYLSTSINSVFDIRFGLQSIFHHFTPVSISSSLSRDDILNTANGFETAVFVENKVTLGKRLSVNGGLRYSVYAATDNFHLLPEPRLSFQYELSRRTSIEFAYAKMRQFIHLLSNGSSGLPNDVWVPVTKKIPPGAADHFSIALDNSFIHLDWSVEVFYKRSQNLADYRSGGSFLFSFENNWEDLIETGGKGEGYGAELFLKRSKGKWNGWLGYSLSWHNQKFDAFNQGNWYPFKYDRRHELELNCNYSFGEQKNKQLAFSWIFQSGIAITTPVAYYLNANEELVPLYTEKNNNRAPNYHRLDISYATSKTSKKGNLRTWNFGLYNAYNRKNPFFISFKNYPIHENPTDFQSPVIGQNNFTEQGTFLPILPYISYEINFK